MRFSEHCTSFSNTLDQLSDREVAAVRRAWLAARADHPAARRRALAEGRPEPLIDIAAVTEALPQMYRAEGVALSRALQEEMHRRPFGWALEHGADAIENFVAYFKPEPPAVAKPLTADEKRAQAQARAEAEAQALEAEAADRLKRADEARARVERFRAARGAISE